MRRRLALIFAAAALASLPVLATQATAVLANDTGFVETGANTYTVNPSKAEIDVTTVLRFTNNTAPDSTHYYYYTQTYAMVEKEATGIKANSDAGAVQISPYRSLGDFTEYRLTFPALYYSQTRLITLSYVIPAGLEAVGGFRASPAYFAVCGITRGYDTSSVQIVVPDAFSASQTGGLNVTKTDSNGMQVFDTGTIPTWSGSQSYIYGSCMEGFNPTALTSSTASTAGASFSIQSWPGDSAWSSTVKSAIAKDLRRLADATGLPLPGGQVTIQETGIERINVDWGKTDVLLAGLGNDSSYDPRTRTLSISQDADEAGIATGLALIWFNPSVLLDTWASQGFASYFETVATGRPCTSMPVDLSPWTILGETSTPSDLTTLEAQQRASCGLVSKIAGDMGAANFKAVVGGIANGTNAYGIQDTTAIHTGLSNRALLDLIDELGMAPAGKSADTTQLLFSQYGVLLDSALTGRTDARAAYAALEKSAGSWKIPLAVRQPMSDWDFTSAASAMDTATQIIKLRDEIQTSVSGSNLSGGTFQTQFEAARTQSDLDAVLKLGQDESEAAKVVASAQSLDNGGKNPLQVIGLIGGNPSGSLKTAIDDLDRAKPGDAKTAAQGAIDTINGSTLQGLIRLAILLVLVLVVVVVMFFLARRRKSAPPFAPVYAGYPGWAGYPGGPSGPGMTPTDDAPANQATGWVAPPTGPAPDASAGAPLGAPGWTASPAPDAALAPVAETPPAPPAAAPDAAGPADGTSTDDSGTVS